jgi:hypothetical protein
MPFLLFLVNISSLLHQEGYLEQESEEQGKEKRVCMFIFSCLRSLLFLVINLSFLTRKDRKSRKLKKKTVMTSASHPNESAKLPGCCVLRAMEIHHERKLVEQGGESPNSGICP